MINTLRPRRNGQYFRDNIFERIFFNENVCISIEISLKFVAKGPINNIPSLVQIMDWRRPGDKSLSEPKMVRLLTHMCVTQPQWVNIWCFTHCGSVELIMNHYTWPSLAQIMAYYLFNNTKPSSKFIFNQTLGSKFQLNWNGNTTIFIKENEPQNAICKMAAFLAQTLKC